MSKKQRDTENITGFMHTRATFNPSTIDKEARTVEVVFATEREVLMYDWNIGRFKEVLVCEDGAGDLARLNNGAPLLDTHRQGSTTNVLGVVVAGTARFVNGQAIAKVRYSKREDVEPVWQDVQDGILTGISVGYIVSIYEETIDVNENAIPTLRATKWEATEISHAPVQADPDSRVRSQDQNQDKHTIQFIRTNSNSSTMTDAEKKAAIATERKRSAAIRKACRAANLSDEYAQELIDSDKEDSEWKQAITDKQAETTEEEEPAENVGLQRKLGAVEERKRSAEITTSCRGLKLPDEFMNKLISDGTPIEKARKLMIDEVAKSETATPSGNSGVQVNRDETDKRRTAMVDGMLLRTANAPKEMTVERKTAAREFRSFTLMDLAKECLTRAGIDYRGMGKMEIAQLALNQGSRAITSSTSDFPVLLGGVIHQTLLGAYATIPDTWREFCAVGSVSDFRPYKRLRRGSFGRLDKVGENGEFKNKAIPDGVGETIKAETYGNTINVSRQMIINDDLQVFTDLAADLGGMAKRSVEIDVYAMLAMNGGLGPIMDDGLTLFHANHGNLIASGAAPSVSTFDALSQAMAAQKDVSGNEYLDLRPSILLTSKSMELAVKLINNSQYDPTVTNKFQVPNLVAGTFEKIIPTQRVSGNGYIALANPLIEPVFEVVFLDGNEQPFLDSQEGFIVDGMMWKVRYDYGMDAVGYRGAVKNPGA